MAKLKSPVSEMDNMTGDPQAPVILVEYGDFQCPHCGAAYPIVKQIVKDYKDKMAFVFRHFPLAEAHPYAQAAALASEAAANQGKFWQMHALIFENQRLLGVEMLLQLAESLKLDMKTFEHDFKDPKLFKKVEDQFESGILSGVNGTPSFYINGIKYEDSYDYESLSSALNQAISKNNIFKTKSQGSVKR
jgi:protein-disulfide isomerase